MPLRISECARRRRGQRLRRARPPFRFPSLRLSPSSGRPSHTTIAALQPTEAAFLSDLINLNSAKVKSHDVCFGEINTDRVPLRSAFDIGVTDRHRITKYVAEILKSGASCWRNWREQRNSHPPATITSVFAIPLSSPVSTKMPFTLPPTCLSYPRSLNFLCDMISKFNYLQLDCDCLVSLDLKGRVIARGLYP